MDTLLLTRSDVARLLPVSVCFQAVERAFRLLGEGRAAPPGTLGVPSTGGGFHIKAGILADGDGAFFAVKCNGNFPGNGARGLPTIQGVLMLCDARDGRVLALMDSAELTARRTAAATAVAARHLARPGSSVVGLIGCGVQAPHQLRALAAVLPLRRVRVYDRDPGRAAALVADLGEELGIEVAASVRGAARGADVVVTCTTSTDFLLGPGEVDAGCFVAGVGVDNESKRELAPGLLAKARVVTDLTAQCALIGDLRSALEVEALSMGEVHAELGALVAGAAAGREHEDEIWIFDSTGIALQDAAAVYLQAVEDGDVARIRLG
jgi:alanine dehydrogenase